MPPSMFDIFLLLGSKRRERIARLSRRKRRQGNRPEFSYFFWPCSLSGVNAYQMAACGKFMGSTVPDREKISFLKLVSI